MRMLARAAVLAALGFASLGGVDDADAQASAVVRVDAHYAPVDRPGPALRPAVADLRKAVTCSGDFHNGKEPVLLVPGTFFTYQSQFAWSWAPALTRAGIPWCSVTPPYNSLGDLSIAGEYDVYAIRHTYHLAGDRRIAIVGHSQGGMRPRWALRFWPDTRAMVADYVGVAPDNRGAGEGVLLFDAPCRVVGCPQGIWQQGRGSAFIHALNSRQMTFRGIDYSVIYSRTDGVVLPSDTPLDPVAGAGYARVAIQDVCPGRIADHLTNGSTDAASWALIMDALTHAGPADPARVDRAVCGNLFLPGLGMAAALSGAANAPLQVARAIATMPREFAEAALPCYVYAAGC